MSRFTSINELINRGRLSIHPPLPPLNERHHKSVIYLSWMNLRKIDGSHYTVNEEATIKNNTGQLFDTVKIGMSDRGIEGALMKIKK